MIVIRLSVVSLKFFGSRCCCDEGCCMWVCSVLLMFYVMVLVFSVMLVCVRFYLKCWVSSSGRKVLVLVKVVVINLCRRMIVGRLCVVCSVFVGSSSWVVIVVVVRLVLKSFSVVVLVCWLVVCNVSVFRLVNVV